MIVHNPWNSLANERQFVTETFPQFQRELNSLEPAKAILGQNLATETLCRARQ